MPGNKARSDDEKLLDQAVRDAGALAMQFYNSSAKSWDKSDGSPVTEADIAVDEFLKDALMKDRPDYGWLSEETTDTSDRLTCQHVWVVDPIDGTRSFIERTNEWSISIALLENNEPVLARIFRPVTQEMYSAVSGGGAMLNGTSIKVTNRDKLENCRMMTRGKVLKLSHWKKPWPPMQTGIITSLALRICLVADGSYDVTLTKGNESDWDLAAGDLIVREAGGCISDVYGKKLTYNGQQTQQSGGMIAAGKPLFNIMLEQANILKNR